METARKKINDLELVKYGLLIFKITGTGNSTLIEGFIGESPYK